MSESEVLENLNKKHSFTNMKALASKTLKKCTNAGTVVVDILGATGIAGFKFHVPESEMVKFENDITDHYVDTGTAIQDHIVQKPITITVTGLVGDYFYSNNKIEDLFALVVPTLTIVKEYILPQLSQALNLKLGQPKELPVIQLPGGPQAPLVGEVAKRNFSIMDLFSLFQSLYKLKSAQTRAFLFLEALWKSRALFSVETTWQRFDNMTVQSIQAKRDNNADITEFTATFKQIAFAETLTESYQQYTNRRIQEMSKTVDKGLENGTQVSVESEFGSV